ncbi:MAG: hypothetical protein IPI54_17655 [Chitinophagaceae bacterium]|nr:hypothetical protein [Chitinophagaceae bacterium]
MYNTTLFNEVKFELVALDANNINISVQVTERWYLYPVPQFNLVDRNFNEWYKTYNASFDRVNYGLKFVHYNLSGRRDQLRVYFINGYSREYFFQLYRTVQQPGTNRRVYCWWRLCTKESFRIKQVTWIRCCFILQILPPKPGPILFIRTGM